MFRSSVLPGRFYLRGNLHFLIPPEKFRFPGNMDASFPGAENKFLRNSGSAGTPRTSLISARKMINATGWKTADQFPFGRQFRSEFISNLRANFSAARSTSRPLRNGIPSSARRQRKKFRAAGARLINELRGCGSEFTYGAIYPARGNRFLIKTQLCPKYDDIARQFRNCPFV